MYHKRCYIRSIPGHGLADDVQSLLDPVGITVVPSYFSNLFRVQAFQRVFVTLRDCKKLEDVPTHEHTTASLLYIVAALMTKFPAESLVGYQFTYLGEHSVSQQV